jgi:hypothetical protein
VKRSGQIKAGSIQLKITLRTIEKMETSTGVNANALEFKATCVGRSTDIGTGRGSDEIDNFPQGCALSPDGLCVLTGTTSDNLLRLYNTPPSSHEDDSPNISTPTIVPLDTALLAQCGDSIRSYAWYPKMNSADPGSCAFLATSRYVYLEIFQ